ncbi:hypothetical protein CONCODRAFT_69514 [Conidiobolus coronatus NRRL 28638]|uniref:Uncharacterized protein n=1 Tax=Conidiobolus coronatus (strain ATCC 28846 / CBS 209.66 / NRRL 28638) TaxID=796925 RepID=A0A137PA43_CONC2|nr:hypothetical protein CONCODRAFT_69514 [Conidiobolus coronatus NRRL 28638]|eukprot:KXN71879.1 hypothetical protein CONCODRAFT_69514 [Conidiobolus coronatus NRRL 28638]
MSIPNLFKVPGWNLPSDIKIEKDPKKNNSNEVVNKVESVKVEAKPIATTTNKREIEETVDQSTTNTNKKKKKNKNKNKKNNTNTNEGENNLVNISFTEKIEEQKPTELSEVNEEVKEEKISN